MQGSPECSNSGQSIESASLRRTQMANLLVEAVVMSFMLGGMLGAVVTLHLQHLKGAKAPAERPAVALVRRRSRI